MDGHQFDDLLRRLAQSRRSLLGIAISSGAALAGHGQTDARKKKRKKKKKKKQKPQCKGATKPCGQECIPTSTCCTPCGSLGTCIDGACVCLEGGKPCQGSCIPVANCCTSAECGAHAVCANGICSCLSGFKACQGQCISLGACCMNESNCGADQDGSCICETASTGQPVCHKEGAVANHATCGECPGGTVCVNADNTAKCYKLCGATWRTFEKDDLAEGKCRDSASDRLLTIRSAVASPRHRKHREAVYVVGSINGSWRNAARRVASAIA